MSFWRHLLQKIRLTHFLSKYRPVLNDTMSKYPDVMLLEMSPSELNKYLNQFYNQILVNYDNYISALKYPMPMFVSEPERREDGSVGFTCGRPHIATVEIS